MLEYANSLNAKRGVSRRTAVCGVASCLAHFLVLVLLIEFPQLFSRGYYHEFRGIQGGVGDDSDEWRTVTILESPRRMEMPSEATLRKALGLGEGDKKGEGTPSVSVRLGNLDAILVDAANPPKIPPKTLPKVDVPEPPILEIQTGMPDIKLPAETETVVETQGDSQSNRGTGEDASAPKKEEPRIEVASNTAPTRIPDRIPDPVPATPKSSGNSGSKTDSGGARNNATAGLFDTKGFPLGEYKEIIDARVRSLWLVPSNLKESQKKTTVIFYIDKKGKCSNLRIETPSGSSSLDISALAAIRDADPFPPLPQGFPGDHIGVKITFVPTP